MTEAVLSIEVTSAPAEILRLFTGYPVHHLPVVDNAKVVGMLSSADLLKLDAFLPKHAARPGDYLNQRVRIDQLMRRPAVTIRASESVERAATLMATHNIHALPVVNDTDKLIGIVTTTDIMYAVLHPERDGSESPGAVMDRSSVPVRLSPSQMDEALRLAGAMADSPEPGSKIARALLHARSRLRVLEEVATCADRYIRAGQDQQLHKLLVRALDRARETG